MNQLAEREEYIAKQKEIEGTVNPIIKKLSGGSSGGGSVPTEASAKASPEAEGPKVEDID